MKQSFTPVRVGRSTLPNRLVMAPMTRSRATFDGTPGELAAEYYAQRAGVGLIVTEGTQPSDDGQGYLLTSDTMTYFHDHYITDTKYDLDWRASPLLHTDLSKLPPALVITAGYDPLRDEGLAYAEALTAAGNRANYVCFERQIHGFITMGKVLDEANTAVALCATELHRALSAS